MVMYFRIPTEKEDTDWPASTLRFCEWLEAANFPNQQFSANFSSLKHTLGLHAQHHIHFDREQSSFSVLAICNYLHSEVLYV